MSETYTIKHGDPKHFDATYRGRKYQISVRTGDVFTIVPDTPASLPICKLERKMQRGFFNKNFNTKPAKPTKGESTEKAEE